MEALTDNFNPVTEGTPKQWAEYVEAECSAYITLGTLDALAARDAAMRRKGMLEAAEICDRVYESDDKARHDSMYLQGFEWGAEKCEQAIRAAMEEE